MSICKRKDGRWQVTYRDSGRIRSKSFPAGRKGKREAEAFDAEIKLKKATDQPLPLGLREGIYLDEIVQEWGMEKKAQGRASSWLSAWASVFRTVFFPTLCQRPAHTLSQSDIMAVIAAHYSGARQATRNRYIGYLKSAINHALERGKIPHNPLAKWTPGKEVRRKSRLTLDDLRKIQGHSPEHLSWALEVAWNIPVRPGKDLFGLRFDRHVRYDRDGVEVFHSKVGKWAFVQCSEGFMRALYDREKASASGYLIEYEGEPVADVGNALAASARRAKLPYSPCMYDLRHLWITTMLDKGLEPSVIAHLAGTSVRMILANYYEPHATEKARAAELLPALSREPEKGRKVVGISEARVVQKRSAKKKKGSR